MRLNRLVAVVGLVLFGLVAPGLADNLLTNWVGIVGELKTRSVTSVADTDWSISELGIATIPHYRNSVSSSLTAATVNLTAAQFRASGSYLVDTTSNAVDVEIAEALVAADRGATKWFFVTAGGTNALTVTADASGVTSVRTENQGAGTSCEDVNDAIEAVVLNTNAILVVTHCAD